MWLNVLTIVDRDSRCATISLLPYRGSSNISWTPSMGGQ